MKKIFLPIICIFVVIQAVSQIDTSEFNKFKREYDEFIKQENEAFTKYKEARDKEFSDFLKKDWENFQLFIENKPISLPGPDKIPSYNSKLTLGSSKKLSPKTISETPKPIVDESSFQLKPIPAAVSPESKKDYDLISLNYYGEELHFIYHKKMKNAGINTISEAQIANFWADVSNSDYYRLIEQMLEYKNSKNLNDFAYMKLAEKVSSQIHLQAPNNAKLLTWFLLAKSGYKLKVGYSGNAVYILVPCVNVIYSYSYFVFENLKYYIFEDETQVKSIYTYRQDYPEANKIMNFNIFRTPILGQEMLSRDLQFTYKDKDYKFAINYNKNLMDFYNDYPQGEIQIFFNAGVSNFVKESLDKNIEPIVSNMSETEAANFLLHFVQTAFDYQTDNEQFGYERFFFPEEIFHYAYCDCEDRAVFYSYLVNEYLRLPVAGLNYPGHMTTAVRFSENIPGSYYLIDNERFVVCDPTYINAPIGVCMPEYQKSEVTIVRLKNTQIANSQNNIIWTNLTNKGYIRTNYENDIIKIDDNNWYVVGLLDSSTNLESKFQKIKNDDEALFLAKVNEKGDIKNIEIIYGDGLLMPIGVAYSKYGIYVSGYYSNNIRAGNNEIKAEYNRELFIACYNENFQIEWIRASGIVNDLETSNMFFAVNMDKKGNFISKDNISEESFENKRAIDISNSDKITIYVKFEAANPLLNDAELYKNPSSYEFAKSFRELTNDLISKNYDKNSAPIIALLKILQNGNISVTGIEIIAAALTMNAEFKNTSPKLFNYLKEIKQISSSNGVISLTLNNPDNFNLANLYFNKTSQFRIVTYKSGNIELIIGSGISYKPYFQKYPVNYFKIFKSTGDICIDYDSDNDQKIINIAKVLVR